MANKPRFSYYQHYVKELIAEKGFTRIITYQDSVHPMRDNPLTDGLARQQGKGFCNRLNKGELPGPFKGIVLSKNLDTVTNRTSTGKRPLGQHHIMYSKDRTYETGIQGQEWMYFIESEVVYTVDSEDVDGELTIYKGTQYKIPDKEVTIIKFSEEFGTVDNCYRGQLKAGGRISAQQFRRIIRANHINTNMNKTDQCKALEQLEEFIWA